MNDLDNIVKNKISQLSWQNRELRTPNSREGQRVNRDNLGSEKVTRIEFQFEKILYKSYVYKVQKL